MRVRRPVEPAPTCRHVGIPCRATLQPRRLASAVRTMDAEAINEFEKAVEAIRRILADPDLHHALAAAARFSDQCLPEGLQLDERGPPPEQHPPPPRRGSACGPRDQARLTQALVRVRDPALLGQQTIPDLNLILDCVGACPNPESGCLRRWETEAKHVKRPH